MKLQNRTTNSIELQLNSGTYLIDYTSIVAYIDNNGTITLGQDWDYSTTTKGKVARFLNTTTKELNLRIKDNIILIDPNLGDDV